MSQRRKAAVYLRSAIVPAVGINAAVNSRDFGTFRWQLNELVPVV
jgi:hypothetical protein